MTIVNDANKLKCHSIVINYAPRIINYILRVVIYNPRVVNYAPSEHL